MKNIALLISTCDAFSDLWDAHIELYKKNWDGPLWKTYMVTDKPTDKSYDGVEIIVAGGNLDFPMRLKYALGHIDEDYILLTLDDYFLIEKTDSSKLDYLADRAEKEKIDYLMLYRRKKRNPKHFTPITVLEPLDLTERYNVTLYPAIWNKQFLYNSVKEDMSPWQYEPLLTKYAREAGANCQFSYTGSFIILDVVRKGKVLHNANSYFKKHGIDIGDRPLISRATEIKLIILERINWYLPRKFVVFCKRILIKCGKSFYSGD